MKQTILFILAICSILVLASCTENSGSGPDPETNKASVRVIHTSHDAPAVDILIDDSEAVSDLAFGASSGYKSVDEGQRSLKITAANSPSTVLITDSLTFEEGKSYTVFAVGALANIDWIVQEDLRTSNSSKAKVRLLHASPDAPPVDVKLGNGSGTALFAGASFMDLSNYLEVDEAAYSFAIAVADTTTEVEVYAPVTVNNGSVYTIVAHGTVNATDPYPFSVRVFTDNGAGTETVDLAPGSSNIMAIHASPDAPGAGLLVDGVLVNTSGPLEFPGNTGYLTADAGIRNLMVNAFGTSNTIIDVDAAFDADKYYSIFAINVLDSIEALVLEDNLAAPTGNNAHVRFIHLSPDAPAVDVVVKSNGAVVFADKEFKEFTANMVLGASTYDLEVRVAGTSTAVLDLPGIVLQPGKVYTIFANGFLSPPTGNDPALAATTIMHN